MGTSLDSLLHDASAFLEAEFGLGVEESELKLYSAESWSRFCEVNGFDEKSEGIYIPSSHTAYAKADALRLYGTTRIPKEIWREHGYRLSIG